MIKAMMVIIDVDFAAKQELINLNAAIIESHRYW